MKNKPITFMFFLSGAALLLSPLFSSLSINASHADATVSNDKISIVDDTNSVAKTAKKYDYYGSDISKIATTIGNPASDGQYFFIDFEVAADEFPIDTGWDKFVECQKGMVITPSGSSTTITKSALIMKRSKTKYTITIPNFSWLNPAVKERAWYDFQSGDKFTMNATFSKSSSTYDVTTTFHDLMFTFDGKNFNCFRIDIVNKVNDVISQLEEEPVYTKQYIDLVKEGVESADKLSSEERKEINDDGIAKLYKQYRHILLDEAEDAGKTTHYSTISMSDIDATSMISSYDSGAVFKHNEIDFFYEESQEYSSMDWNHNHKGYSDSYFLYPDGEISYVRSAIVLYREGKSKEYIDPDGRYLAVYIFVSWANTAFDTTRDGVRYVVNETGYTFEKDGHFYLVEVEGGDFLWTGSYWINTSSAPTIPALCGAIENIGTVEYTEECKARIDLANNIYNSLSDAESKWVSNKIINKLTSAQNEYKLLEIEKKTDDVVKSIDNIGTVEYTEECKARIDYARKMYDSASEEVKANIPNDKVQILVNAENTYTELADIEAAKACVDLINNIGTVEYTDESYARILAARASYDSLAYSAQNKVTDEQLQILLDAENRYAILASTDEFKSVVASLNENSTLDQIYSVVMQARSLYALIPDKTLVASEYNKLLEYIEKYNAEVEEFNGEHKQSINSALLTIVASLATLAGASIIIFGKKGLF